MEEFDEEVNSRSSFKRKANIKKEARVAIYIIICIFKYSSLASQVLKDGSELDEETNSSFTDQEKSERKLQF